MMSVRTSSGVGILADTDSVMSSTTIPMDRS
jgi:hypothetical protein